MDIKQLRAKLREIVSRQDTLHPNDYLQQNECWNEMIKLLTQNQELTILYLDSSDDLEEVLGISEVWDELVEFFLNKKIIETLGRVVDKFGQQDAGLRLTYKIILNHFGNLE